MVPLVVAIKSQPEAGPATTAGVNETPVVVDDAVVVGRPEGWRLPPQLAMTVHTAVTTAMNGSAPPTRVGLSRLTDAA
jgi:hypothetical protein